MIVSILNHQNVDTERSRALADSSNESSRKCNEKIKTIFDQFKELELTLSEMDTDFSNTISDQLDALGGVIDELCKEGDGLVSQINASSANVGREIDNFLFNVILEKRKYFLQREKLMIFFSMWFRRNVEIF